MDAVELDKIINETAKKELNNKRVSGRMDA